MTLERIFDLLREEQEKAEEFRHEVLQRLTVLETKDATEKDGWRTLGWVLTFLISLAAFGVSLSAKP